VDAAEVEPHTGTSISRRQKDNLSRCIALYKTATSPAAADTDSGLLFQAFPELFLVRSLAKHSPSKSEGGGLEIFNALGCEEITEVGYENAV
jgi:hypothetical protein